MTEREMTEAEDCRLLAVGVFAYDSIKTPYGFRERALGGSAAYFAVAARRFSQVSVVGVVGRDFDDASVDVFRSRGVDLSGLEFADGETFYWSCVYLDEDVNRRETLDTRLNVFADFQPVLSERHRRAPFLFLANMEPALQLDVLNQMRERPKFVAMDSMNFWIDRYRAELDAVVPEVDALMLDEGEALSYSGAADIPQAAARLRAMGPRVVVIKQGARGATVFGDGNDGVFHVPAFPVARPVDPTGAGDSFAGAFMGAIAASGDLSPGGLRRAAALGCAMGSFAVEDFGMDRILALQESELEARRAALSKALGATNKSPLP